MQLMNRIKEMLILLALAAGLLPFISACSDDDSYSLDKFMIEIMTVKPLGGGEYYLVRDNGETLWPLANNDYTFRPESKQRVQLNYTMLSDSISGYSHGIRVNRVDEILTKPISPNEGIRNDSIYGTDPIELIAMETGGGYLDILFGAEYGNSGKKHFINLIPASENDSTSYELEFRHNAYNDQPLVASQGLVSFDLSALPDTGGKTVKLKIKFHTFDGPVVKEIDYNSNSHTYTGSVLRAGSNSPSPIYEINE